MVANHQPNGQVFIVSAARTPIGKFGGALAAIPATELGGVAIRAAVERAGMDPATAVIDDVLIGQVLQAGAGQAPARQAVLNAGLPDTTSATTINRVCGSGLKAIMLAASEIRAGDAEVAIEGGHMGTHAERVAIKDQVSRSDQDAYALASHQKAIAAIDAGRFEAGTAP